MKAIVCEMCNSNDVLKQGDYYICQNCGTKYEPEAAKKLLVEVDNSKKLTNLYERARKSLEVNDLEHAAEYYKEILDENPNDWEAYFYSYLGETTTFTNAEAGTVASKLGNTIPAAYDMALQSAEGEEAAERMKTITTKTVERISSIALSGALLLRQYEGGNILTPTGKVNADLYRRMRSTAQTTIACCVLALNELEDKTQELSKDTAVVSTENWNECLLAIRRSRFDIENWTFSPSTGMTEKLFTAEKIKEHAELVKELDPEFKIPEISSSSTSTGGGGCYVATAVYGSYDCPQVWTLRRFRDYDLAQTYHGRTFIKAYYAISPTIVKWFGNTEWFNLLWRGCLDSLVKKCQAKGYADTPYEDRSW